MNSQPSNRQSSDLTREVRHKGRPSLPPDKPTEYRASGKQEAITVEPPAIEELCDGHRRTAAAVRVGLDAIPCWISSKSTPDEAMEQWAELQENQRVITTEQKSRLNDAVLERKTAKSQQSEMRPETVAGISDQILAPIPDSTKDSVSKLAKPDQKKKKPPGEKRTAGRKSKPKTDRQIATEAAKKSGLGSAENARLAGKVVEAIDKAELAGDTAPAAELRDTLNNHSVNAAVKKLEEKKAADIPADPTPEAPTDETGRELPAKLVKVFETRALFETLLKKIAEVFKAHKALLHEDNDEATHKLNRAQSLKDLTNYKSHIKFAMPYAICPYCHGTGTDKGGGCLACKGTGWVVKLVYDTAPSDYR